MEQRRRELENSEKVEAGKKGEESRVARKKAEIGKGKVEVARIVKG